MTVQNHKVNLGAVPMDPAIVDAIGKVRCTASPNFRIGTTSAKALKSDAFSAYLGGVAVPVAAVETAFTATTHDVAADKEARFLVCCSRAGVLTLVKGADAVAGASVDPAATADTVVVGRVTIVTVGSAFDATTDDLDAAHLTVTYEDLGVVLTY